STSELFRGSPEPREQVLLAHGNYVGMRDDEKRIYENRIASFFLLNLPPSGRPRRYAPFLTPLQCSFPAWFQPKLTPPPALPAKVLRRSGFCADDIRGAVATRA